MSLADAYACPVCGHRLLEAPNDRGREPEDVLYYDCARCGTYGLTQEAVAILPALSRDDPRNMATLAFALRRMEAAQDWPVVPADVLQRIIATAPLPSALEQADNLVRWLGDNVSPESSPISTTCRMAPSSVRTQRMASALWSGG